MNRLASRWDTWTGRLVFGALLVVYIGVCGSIAVGIKLGVQLPMSACGPGGTQAACRAQVQGLGPGDHAGAEAATSIAMLAALGIAVLLLALALFSVRWKDLATSRSSAPWQDLSAGPMGLLAALMHVGRGELWLSEVLSSLSECSPQQQSAIIRSYRDTAGIVIARSWARAARHGPPRF